MSHGGQCLAAFFVKMSGLFWPVLRRIMAVESLHVLDPGAMREYIKY